MPSRLKSLELHGFKTFANRTLFEFSGTVTAIVGPNGSGKSNIADSLRWVLGEQSYSLLRAKKTEDMIFAGSESRTRAGMASASITFDNSDGWLPIDFSEVAITRRAYRDGENEYQINGQRVRLKDVSELLAQSGLAERTYTVIGQGLVDAALSLKAEERRRLFEEAAGIGLHRSRREDALRRLDATKRNLERVEDILAELQPRLQSLERQARRAREYEQIKADLRVLLRDWYGYHWHQSQHEVAEARETVRIQETRVERARQEQIEQEQKLSALRERSQGLRSNLNTWHRQSAQLHNRRETLSRDLAVSEERGRSLVDQQQGIQAELANLEQEFSLRREQLSAALRDVERQQTELQEAHTQVNAARQALDARQVERARVERLLRDARQEQAALSARQGQLQALLGERRAQNERARKALDDAAQALLKAEQEQQASEMRLQAAQQAEKDAQAERMRADQAVQTQRQRVETAEQERKHLQEERATLNAERTRLKAQLDVLDQAEAALTGYASGTRLLLQAAAKNRLPGMVGALSSQIEAPAELETAISAALGEYLDAVIFQDDIEPALDVLQTSGGRGVLLPLTQLKHRSTLHVEPAPDVLGVASALVSVSAENATAELRQTLELLLGQVVVVQDRAAARRALAGQPAGARAVTLRGEVFHALGPVQTYGTNEAGQTASVLSRSRQRRELAQNLEGLTGRVRELEERLRQAEAVLRELQSTGAALNQAQQQVRQGVDKAVQLTNQARLSFEQARRQAQWQHEQRQRLQDDITRSDTDAANLSKELTDLEGRLAQARERVRKQASALDGLALDEFQTQLAHWNTMTSVGERALNEARARQQERGTALERLQKTQTVLQTRFTEAVQAQEKLGVERAALRQAETEVSAQIKDVQALIEPSEANLETLEAEQAELEKAESAARQVFSSAEHVYAQTRITLDRRQEALQALRRRIEEDFGLVAFEYSEQVSGPTPLPLGEMVEQLPVLKSVPPELEEAIKRQRAQLRRMGAVNPEAQIEYLEVKQRHVFLTEQVADLRQAESDVRQVIAELDVLMEREFRKTFQAVAVEFKQIFTRLFGGGAARLLLTDPENMTTTGIDIEARLPGRRSQGLSLLSGGERSLTAVALIFSLLKVSPTPFCVLDEVDAMLDEMNVGRFRDLLRELSENTQFVIVTHNRNTVQVAEVIYGVTMGRDSASQVLSLRLDQVSQVVE